MRTSARGRDVDFDSVLLPWCDNAPLLQVADLEVHGDGVAATHALRIRLSIDGRDVHDGWFHARGVLARRWCIGVYEFTGRWLHWREAADGSILRAVSHAGATLLGPGGAIALTVEDQS